VGGERRALLFCDPRALNLSSTGVYLLVSVIYTNDDLRKLGKKFFSFIFVKRIEARSAFILMSLLISKMRRFELLNCHF
jgi:hypothetical protein